MARMSKEAFKFFKMIERRIHIAKREGETNVELMVSEETYKMIKDEVLDNLLEKQILVEFYYNPILFGDNLDGDYRVKILWDEE